MKLVFIAVADPLDVRTWSGIPFNMFHAAQVEFQNCISIYIPPSRVYEAIRWRIAAWTNYSVDLNWLKVVAAANSRSVLRSLKKLQPDLVICIANTPIGAYVSCDYPLIHVSDATFALMENYYDDFARFRPWVRQNCRALEHQIITQSKACLYSSEWAANSAIHDYGANPEKVHFARWGCNLDSGQEPEDFAKRIGPSTPCPIVFFGVDWERKGGEIALATVMRLRQMGIQAHLHVVGVKPKGAKNCEAVTWHGFISKATPQGVAHLDSLLRQTAFLLLPSRQDCTPMVIAEVNRRGVPAITTLTGGIGSIVEQGINGYALSYTDGPQAYADLIANTWSHPRQYLALRESSRSYCETRLNWGLWAARLREIVEEMDF